MTMITETIQDLPIYLKMTAMGIGSRRPKYFPMMELIRINSDNRFLFQAKRPLSVPVTMMTTVRVRGLLTSSKRTDQKIGCRRQNY